MLLFITPHGVREVAGFSLFWIAIGTGLFFVHPVLTVIPAAGFVFCVAFFRDPARNVPPGPDTLVSPADGKVTDIVDVTEENFLKEPTVRVGIFLSVFDVHVNRTPCAGTVKNTLYTPGRFLDARHPECDRLNERNDIVIERKAAGGDKVMVRQISGAIARRIVCACRENDVLEKGQRVGMIKFGSRTELYVPKRFLAEVSVRVGDRVKGGETVIARVK